LKIILNSTDKKALELCHSKTRDVRESDLIKAVLLSSEGWSVSQISQALRKHETTLLRQCERIYLNEFSSINALQKDVDDYIEFYNHRRFHETLAYKKNNEGV
jgi:AraC-like DNA-binding protein